MFFYLCSSLNTKVKMWVCVCYTNPHRLSDFNNIWHSCPCPLYSGKKSRDSLSTLMLSNAELGKQMDGRLEDNTIFSHIFHHKCLFFSKFAGLVAIEFVNKSVMCKFEERNAICRYLYTYATFLLTSRLPQRTKGTIHFSCR
uniref:Uncharacterized protein n=1 Tax=Cacopsylla melanoneura TaxID=428564 RepID=A0A8D9BX01_9HEMI